MPAEPQDQERLDREREDDRKFFERRRQEVTDTCAELCALEIEETYSPAARADPDSHVLQGIGRIQERWSNMAGTHFDRLAREEAERARETQRLYGRAD
jgi:hypothetical protein